MKYLLLLFWILLPYSIFAQLSYGVKLDYGIGLTNSELIRYDDFDDFVIYNITMTDQRLSPGFAFQVFFKDKYSDLFLQSELAYRSIHTHFEIKSDLPSDLRTFAESKRSNYLRFPVIGGYEMSDLRFGIGAELFWLFSESNIFEDLLYFDEQRNTLESAIVLLIGYKIGSVNLELTYEYFFNGAADYIYHKDLQRGFSTPPQFLTFGLSMLF